MPWYKRLRWRLIGSQFIVAFVGVAVMMLATRVIIFRTAPTVIEPYLTALIENPQLLSETETLLIYAFRNAVLASVLVAAVAAIVAGVFSSYMLWRIIIAPLRALADGSRRIADGRFNERVSVPENTGEAMAQLVVNFNEMAETLEHVEEQRVTLLNNLSHELRTPLTGLKGYLEGLQDGMFASNEETYGWMVQEVDRLSRLVDDMQRLSRVEAGQVSLHIETFDVREVVQRVLAQMQPQAQTNEIALLADMPQTAVSVLADPDRTAQILLNLLSNALRYALENGRIQISVQQKGQFAKIAVQDNGSGIPAEALPYLFERFYRVDQSRARTSGGSGIGLAIARYLVWAMGGEITAVSEGEGKGSMFTFTLPISVMRDT